MDSNVFYVYLHRRADNNEVFYVGKGKNYRATSKSSRSDWWRNIVNKAGGYTVEYVEKGLSEESAFDLEVELIKFYKESGHTLCNLTNGGDGCSGFEWSDEQREIASKTRKGIPKEGQGLENIRLAAQRRIGVKRDPAIFDKLRATRKAKGPRIQSDEEKAKRLASRLLQENHKGVSVLCVETGMIFISYVAAAKWVTDNTEFDAISSVICNSIRRNKSCCSYGYHWQLVDKEQQTKELTPI